MLSPLSTIAQDSYSLYVGQQKFISTPEAPYDGAVYSSIWTPNGPIEIISQSAGGAMLRPYSYYQGTVPVSCTYYFRWLDSSGYYHNGNLTKTFYITCIPSYATLSQTSLTIDAGETKRLTYTNSYTGYDDYTRSRATWTSLDTDVATVSSDGTVEGVGSGSCTIVLDPIGGPVVYCDVTVSKVDPTGISLSPTASCHIEGTVQLTPTLTPKYASSDLSWWSDNTDIATVNPSGLVTGVTSGSTKIWVKTDIGGYTAFSTVTVSEPPFTLESTSPANNATDIATNSSVSATFSLDLFQGPRFADITLHNTQSDEAVKGTVSINGKTITFKPENDLSSMTVYRLTIPALALQNKWGTAYTPEVIISFTTTVNPADIKYIVLWNKDGSTTAIPLEGRPVITYDTDNSIITCNTTTTEVTFPLKDIYKYTLELTEKPGTDIRSMQVNKPGDITNHTNILLFNGFKPNTAITVYTANGTMVESRRADNSGQASLSMSGWPKGMYIIKAGNVSHKILRK